MLETLSKAAPLAQDLKCPHSSLGVGFAGNRIAGMEAPFKPRTRRSARVGALPQQLVSRTALGDLRSRLEEQKVVRKTKEPDWQALRDSFREKHKLSEADADEAVCALERLWLLPFHRYDACASCILFFFSGLPEAERDFRKSKDREGLLLCRAYRIAVEILLQGISVFPHEPQHIAHHLKTAIESPVRETRAHILPLARLLASAENGQCGGNRYLTKSPNEVALFEHLARHGRYEGIMANDYKLKSYTKKIEAMPLFRQEWDALKDAFKEHPFWDKNRIVRRSALPEGNWHREAPPHFKTVADRFQAAFDVFCWKWFLYGMQRETPHDQPLVQKIIYTFGPFGTSIFIPGYWSMDLNRDLNWDTIRSLHRARGTGRQGEKADRNKEQAKAQARLAKEADREAKRKGLRGEQRYLFIKEKAGLSTQTDNAQVRKLVRERPC